MTQIEDQRVVIDQLYQIVSSSRPKGVGEARCRFDYQRFEDGSTSVEQQFVYKQNGDDISSALNRDIRKPVTGLVKQLHQLMKAHTGGEWSAMTLTIEQDGRVTTKFEYPNQGR